MIISVISFVVAVLLAIGGIIAWNIHLDRKAAATRTRLQSAPEVSLIIPGSTPLGTAHNDGDCFTRAEWSQRFGTNTPRAEVVAYYERELAARSWHEPYGGVLGPQEDQRVEWNKEEFTFRLATTRPDMPGAARYITIYEINLSTWGRC